MTTHIRIRRVLEQYRLGPDDKGSVGIGELASLIEEALDLRARDEAIIRATCNNIGSIYDDEHPIPDRRIDAIIAAAEQETP